MMKSIPPRLFGIKARRAPVIVLFRRGPSRWTQLIRWSTSTDTFEEGQWLNARVFEHRSDLSPKGEFLIYFASNYAKREVPTWTAISRPPYWTAVRFFDHGDSWGGGGLMMTDNRFQLNGHVGGRYPSFAKRLERDGWQLEREFAGNRNSESDYRELSLPNHDKTATLVMRAHASSKPRPAGKGCYFEEYSLRLPGSPVINLPDVEWADWDAAGRLVFARDGCIYSFDVANLKEQKLFTATTNSPTAIAPPAWAVGEASLELVV